MGSKVRRREQKPKVTVRSPEAKALTLSRRGGAGDRIPSAKAYTRPVKHRGRGWDE